MNSALEMRYDPRLVEETVFLAARQTSKSRAFGRERDQIYKVPDPELREELFQQLNRSWFVKWGLDRPIKETLAEQPLILSLVTLCVTVLAARASDEGAELFVASDRSAERAPRRTLRLMIRPQSLLAPEPLRFFLRRELFHIADMLDPAFVYEPALPKTGRGALYDRVIADRYRILWDTTIAGRMSRRGWADQPAAETVKRDFLRAFPTLKHGEEWFKRFLSAQQPTHPNLAAFALDPGEASGKDRHSSGFAASCPLCRFPTYAFEPEPEALDRETSTAIIRDFPAWRPAAGLCSQCADLYRSRRLSTEAAQQLPGSTTRTNEPVPASSAAGQD